MGGVIYLIQDNDQLVEMAEQEYDSENLLQKLLAQYSNLLSGEQINSAAPRRWLFVKREAGLPSEEGGGYRWSVDHLFLDQDAIPTLVEVKRSTDTRVRREVVGQMLDYAANAVVYWPVERIQAQFEATCQINGQEAEDVLLSFLDSKTDDPKADADEFWEKVKTNLQAGKIRLLFVADKIPTELQRIVEFLNAQMDPAEVLALEVKQYAGQGLKTLVSTVIGQTAKPAPPRETRQWDEISFFEELQIRQGEEDTKGARQILEWAQSRNLRIWWGRGKRMGSFFPLLDHQGEVCYLFSIWTYGTIEIQFQFLQKTTPFIQEKQRLDLLGRLNKIPEISIPLESITKRPSIPLSTFRNESKLEQFLKIFDWVMDTIKSSDE